uniref:Uncharacterized protein n=1 Tax=Roseihalotalea indica TaxID=2867963 RepID=A0AA49GJ26_9BACT|nr:hypothetical protein K4G66_21390 [Tunicatimonas sp. TK19036]
MTQLFSTENSTTYQSDQERCFYVHFQGRQIALSACALIAFKTKVDAIDLVDLLTRDSDYTDTAIVSTCNRDAFFVLSIREIIELKELLSGTLVMLELNSILHRQLKCGIS